MRTSRWQASGHRYFDQHKGQGNNPDILHGMGHANAMPPAITFRRMHTGPRRNNPGERGGRSKIRGGSGGHHDDIVVLHHSLVDSQLLLTESHVEGHVIEHRRDTLQAFPCLAVTAFARCTQRPMMALIMLIHVEVYWSAYLDANSPKEKSRPSSHTVTPE